MDHQCRGSLCCGREVVNFRLSLLRRVSEPRPSWGSDDAGGTFSPSAKTKQPTCIMIMVMVTMMIFIVIIIMPIINCDRHRYYYYYHYHSVSFHLFQASCQSLVFSFSLLLTGFENQVTIQSSSNLKFKIYICWLIKLARDRNKHQFHIEQSS